ncbi:cytochrome c oxidase subunit II [Inquilinus sp. Marseille-Q2685]|uniref:cytochrome c oxidase subunit II n=1 Tax=Inquilinus sp. Marseille-Q2685 TaxID=2866581 RepID=UPI001CE49C35|nr:cytochrome c oxidase subunit II [Inquilinus sp. Marseille-Q2685]
MTRLLVPLGAALLAGCSRWPGALSPMGEGSDRIAGLFWLFTAVCAAVWLLVALALAIGIARRRADRPDPLAEEPRRDRVAYRVVGTCVAATGLILVALTGFSWWTGKGLAALGERPALTLKVTASQWWWQVQYEDDQPSRVLTTANEIHIPVGEPVQIKLEATDVIHSFWVPQLTGKGDLIPGRQNVITVKADAPGRYRGQCAEFCGLQHAKMALLVIAEPRAEFDAWREAQLAPAAEPQEAEARRGRDVFLSRPCLMCHQIRGTSAGARSGPELTHFASRETIAAGVLPMTRGALAAWIADPQAVKPGSNMPRVRLDADELNALVAYLEALK